MATSYLTSNALIESVKRRESIPASQVTFQDDDFLAFANEEIALGILPTIMQYHQEHLVYTTEIPLEQDRSEYPIPERAIGGKIRTLNYRNNDIYRDISRILEENALYYRKSGNIMNQHGYFYVQNTNIVLVPEVTAATGSLCISYYLRPNQLVLLERAAIITAIDFETGVVTVSETAPSIMLATTSGYPTLDMIEARGGHRTKKIDITPTSITGTTFNFDPADLPTDLVKGDYINLSSECCIPQIPDDLHVMLAQRVAARCLEALGDAAGLAAANQKLGEMEQKTANLIDNRTEGNPIKAINLRGALPRRRNRL